MRCLSMFIFMFVLLANLTANACTVFSMIGQDKAIIVGKSYDWLFRHGHGALFIVHDITARKIYFRTLNSPQIKSVDLAKVDFSPEAEDTMMDINSNFVGEANSHLIAYTDAANKALIDENYLLIGPTLRKAGAGLDRQQ